MLPGSFCGADSCEAAWPCISVDVRFSKHIHAKGRCRFPFASPLSRSDAARCHTSEDKGGSGQFRYGEIPGSDRGNSLGMEFEPAAISKGHASTRKGSYS